MLHSTNSASFRLFQKQPAHLLESSNTLRYANTSTSPLSQTACTRLRRQERTTAGWVIVRLAPPMSTATRHLPGGSGASCGYCFRWAASWRCAASAQASRPCRASKPAAAMESAWALALHRGSRTGLVPTAAHTDDTTGIRSGSYSPSWGDAHCNVMLRRSCSPCRSLAACSANTTRSSTRTRSLAHSRSGEYSDRKRLSSVAITSMYFSLRSGSSATFGTRCGVCAASTCRTSSRRYATLVLRPPAVGVGDVDQLSELVLRQVLLREPTRRHLGDAVPHL